MESGQVDGRGLVVAGGDAALLLEAVDAPFDSVAPLVRDDLRIGMILESGRERLRGAVGQHVYDPVGFDVAQDSAAGAALAEGEFVHAQHPRSPVRHRRCCQEPEPLVPARGQP